MNELTDIELGLTPGQDEYAEEFNESIEFVCTCFHCTEED